MHHEPYRGKQESQQNVKQKPKLNENSGRYSYTLWKYEEFLKFGEIDGKYAICIIGLRGWTPLPTLPFHSMAISCSTQPSSFTRNWKHCSLANPILIRP